MQRETDWERYWVTQRRLWSIKLSMSSHHSPMLLNTAITLLPMQYMVLKADTQAQSLCHCHCTTKAGKESLWALRRKCFFSSLYSVTTTLSHFQVTLILANVQSLSASFSPSHFFSAVNHWSTHCIEQLLDPCSQDHQDSFFSWGAAVHIPWQKQLLLLLLQFII